MCSTLTDVCIQTSASRLQLPSPTETLCECWPRGSTIKSGRNTNGLQPDLNDTRLPAYSVRAKVISARLSQTGWKTLGALDLSILQYANLLINKLIPKALVISQEPPFAKFHFAYGTAIEFREGGVFPQYGYWWRSGCAKSGGNGE